jgi:SAM-dependent methyltransferase
MHPVNALLAAFGLRLSSRPRFSARFRTRYAAQLAQVRSAGTGFAVIEEPLDEAGDHPLRYYDAECAFAAQHLAEHAPRTILDVGSYRMFVSGLVAHMDVTTLDVRDRPPATPREHVITGDAKALDIADGAFDAVTTLGSVEHFGLGRYGDDLDLDGDRKAVREMTRVLRPGGFLILTTTITNGEPVLAFNSHRIYTRERLHALLDGLQTHEEAVYNHATARVGPLDSATSIRGIWDVYMSCWQKPE